MEQGGILYWSELYPDVGNLNVNDGRNCIIPVEIKYASVKEVWEPVLARSCRCMGVWEEYDLSLAEVVQAIEILEGLSDESELPVEWVRRAADFLKNSLILGKAIALAVLGARKTYDSRSTPVPV